MTRNILHNVVNISIKMGLNLFRRKRNPNLSAEINLNFYTHRSRTTYMNWVIVLDLELLI